METEMETREFRIKQGGMVVAGTCGQRAFDEMLHLVVQYADEDAGPVTIDQKINGRWRLFGNVGPAPTGDLKEFATLAMPTPSGCGPIGETDT